MAEILLGGGCFWCIEGALKELRGVTSVTPGYSGGSKENPTYEEVCSGETGHAEVVRLTYSEESISTQTLLEVFFTLHDPTQLNRQGGDIGTQYRSIIFYSDEQQREAAEEAIQEAATMFSDQIVTEIVAAEVFYPAEEYHHDYFAKNPNHPYCMRVVGPKVRKTRAKHADLYV